MSGVTIIQPALAQFLGWTGPVGHDLKRRGRTLEFRARTTAGISSGKLRLDIETREKTVVDGLMLEIGNWHTKYAAAHHEGADAHLILPRKPGGRLVFKVGSRTVFAKSVQHPGNQPNPYLKRWLNEAVR